MKYAQSVSPQELAHINDILKDVNIAISTSMSYIRKFHGWSFDQLEQRLIGIPASTWQRYLQPSYQKIRPMPVVAAYSWLSMLPMPCFYRGLDMKEAYPDIDDTTVDCLIHLGILPKSQFGVIIDHLLNHLNTEQKQEVALSQQAIETAYGALDDYEDHHFSFPKTLDMEAFSYDYYYSLAIGLQTFREQNQLSMETMANVLNLSIHRYKQCENPESPTPLPVELGARLQVGFRLNNALPFTANMQKFPQYHTARRIQEIRQSLFISIIKYISISYKKKTLKTIIDLASIVKEIERQKETLEKATKSIATL